MVLPSNILAISLILFQCFHTQSREMKFISRIASLSWASIENKSVECCSKPNTDSCNKCNYCVYISNQQTEQQFVLLFMTSDEEIENKTEKPEFVSFDYNSTKIYSQVMFITCNDKGEELNQLSTFVKLSSESTYEYECTPCIDFKNIMGLNGDFKVVNKYIQGLLRHCILIIRQLYLGSKQVTKQGEVYYVSETLKVNEEEFKYDRSFAILVGKNNSVFITEGGVCETVYQNVSKISIIVTSSSQKLKNIEFGTNFIGDFNKKMYFFYQGNTPNMQVSGHLEKVTVSTVVGMKGLCEYTSPISCSDTNSTRCFLKDVRSEKCTPGVAYCDRIKCKNGGRCKTFGYQPACECPVGYYGSTCNMKECEGGCNNGLCTRYGYCSCHYEWYGPNCSIKNCSNELCNDTDCNETSNEYGCGCNSTTNFGKQCEYQCEPECLNGTCALIGGNTTCICSDGDKLSVCKETANLNTQKQEITVARSNSMLTVCLTQVIVIVIIIVVIVLVKKYHFGKVKKTINTHQENYENFEYQNQNLYENNQNYE